jgi:hypothetical protein
MRIGLFPETCWWVQFINNCIIYVSKLVISDLTLPVEPSTHKKRNKILQTTGCSWNSIEKRFTLSAKHLKRKGETLLPVSEKICTLPKPRVGSCRIISMILHSNSKCLTVRALLDSGSSPHIISNKLVPLLQL